MNTYRVSWEIDIEANSPEEAAATIWQDIFNRSSPAPDDACVFSVTDPTSNNTTLIDLADIELANFN